MKPAPRLWCLWLGPGRFLRGLTWRELLEVASKTWGETKGLDHDIG